jgi:hypothetical protein
MTATQHKHAWRATAHLDGCHYYTTIARCRCGAGFTRTQERDPKGETAMIWMEPQYVEVRRDARGRFVTPHTEERVCDRCRELMAGALPRYDVVVFDKHGEVVDEQHGEIPF